MDHPYEDDLKQYSRILGMDEAGRGPIAGPVCVAGVVFPPDYRNPKLDDSKKLTEKKREALFYEVLEHALDWKIVMVDEKTIDEKNIYRAVQEAMEQLAQSLPCDYVLTDAMPLRNGVLHESLIHGDARSQVIAAASILAKVSRDRYMKRLDAQYPQYGFAKHKGYPTKAHLQALDTYGLAPCYRASYGPVARILEKENEIRLF